MCRVTQDLEEVVAKIKAKEAEQAHTVGPGDDVPLHKALAMVDKKAVTANRTHMLSGNKTGDGRKNAGPDPYSRKRTIEKNYWSTGNDKVKVEVKAQQQEQVDVKQVCYCFVCVHRRVTCCIHQYYRHTRIYWQHKCMPFATVF